MKNLREERLGEINRNTQGSKMKIIEYQNSKNITIRFLDKNGYEKTTGYSNFQKGEIINPFHRNVCGVGYIGLTKTSKNGKVKKSYDVWNSMINRCYNKKEIIKRPTYKSCYVCEEWHSYENFEKWYNENYYDVGENGNKMCLDKDILIKGNKKYSPSTCVFVPNNINCLFTKTNKNRGDCPVGVKQDKKTNKYVAQISKTIKHKEKIKVGLGYFDSKEEAFYNYKEEKEKHIKYIADLYRSKIPMSLYTAMYSYRVEITD